MFFNSCSIIFKNDRINKFDSSLRSELNKFDLTASAAKIIFLGLIVFLFTPFLVRASETEFNIDPTYDYLGRTKINVFLHQVGVNAYFYVESDFYQNLEIDQRKSFTEALQKLSQEFDEVIYPKIRASFGSEWKPGIDNDDKITVLLARIKGENGGYFNSADEYSKIQFPTSNEREIVYLNVNYIQDPLFKSYLAHEFLHLVTFNQKTRIQGKDEEVWLNEMRADLMPTILGYDTNYAGSNLQKRAQAFIQTPEDSLTEWRNTVSDYGVVNLFGQYLLDHYGEKILIDSLKSDKIGILSLDEALKKNGFNKDLSQIFTDWLITLTVNDCSVGINYCYLNPNLKNLRVIPRLIYLPTGSESTLTVTNYTKEWAGNWFKFVGGNGTLKLNFIGNERINFEAPYLIQDSSGKYFLSFLSLDSSQNGTVFISNFGSKYDSFVLIPSVQNKISGFGGSEPYHQFIWSASIIGESSGNNEVVKSLLSQVEFLKTEIAMIQAQINAILGGQSGKSCQKLENNLYYGMNNNDGVRCLQEFLKSQGSEIYPEGQVTGNFLSLTQQAVIRFQEKYASEILMPLGLRKGTGFVGNLTRVKINQLLSSSY